MEQNQGTGGQHGTYMGQGQQNGGGQAGRVDQGPGFQILHYDIRNQQFAPQPEPRADQPEPNSLQPPAMQKYMHNNMVQRPSFQGMPIHMLQPQHTGHDLSLIHISEPTRLLSISYAVFCLKKKKKKNYLRHHDTFPQHKT
eukprot:TRINITY_DN4956_c0_g2_i6.p1 TRINITY_DN4956_c0_g2~~TRINITY_DN4956_c0_g2_i6.p1  ORF type:complete len:141 (+),score=37.96 TRINITY_DN4956_c0_g2_i6:252-674(+)